MPKEDIKEVFTKDFLFDCPCECAASCRLPGYGIDTHSDSQVDANYLHFVRGYLVC